MMYTEGKAKIRYHDKAFLNPDAKLSRDLSVAFVKSVADIKTRILDTTAATGISGIRYYLETGAKSLTLLDINRAAYLTAKRNLRFNRVKAVALNKSMQEFANTTKEKFDVIDLDPFGSISPNLFDLMKIAKNGTHMLLTATDTAVLCGAHPKACVKIYDARPLHNELCHETGIRIMLGYVARVAAQFNFGIDVLLAVSYMRYMRVFVRLNRGAKNTMNALNNLGYVYYCNRCYYRTYETSIFPKQSLCAICKNKLDISGKMWLGNLYDADTIAGIRKNFLEDKSGKELRFLEILGNELDIPLYYLVPKLTKKLGIGAVSHVGLINELKESGFEASETHMLGSSIRTNASIKDIERALKKTSKRY